MKDAFAQSIPTLILKAVIILIGIGAVAFLLWEPQVEGVNAHATNFEIYFKDPFLALVYIGSIPFFVALYNAFKLLGYARYSAIFSKEALQSLRTIRYCAFIVIGFVVMGEMFILLHNSGDDKAGGVFMGILVVFGSVVAAAGATVFEQIVQSAKNIQSENNLTAYVR